MDCGSTRGRAVAIAAVVAVAAFCSASASQANAVPLLLIDESIVAAHPDGARHVIPVIDRPEIRSYQPYFGLQYGFRPEPPVQRGVRVQRPRVVMPKPVAPLIEYDASAPYDAQGYAYCAEQTRGIELREGPYAGRPLTPRQCP